MFYDLVDNYSSSLDIIPCFESISLEDGGLELCIGDIIERNSGNVKGLRFKIENITIRYDANSSEPFISATLRMLFGGGGSIIVDVPELLKVDEKTGEYYFRKVDNKNKNNRKGFKVV